MIYTIPDFDYWKNRFKQLEDARYKKSLAKLQEIKKAFDDTTREINNEILKWIAKFADNNNLTFNDALTILKKDELKEFRWDVKDYIRHGEENNVSADWNRELINASTKFHITRLEKLKFNTRKHIEDLYVKYGNEVSDLLEDTYVDDYLQTAYEMSKGFNTAFQAAKPDEHMVKNILAKPWAPDKYNFSQRIWNNKNKLVSAVHNELTKALLMELDPQKTINNIAAKMNTSKFNAGRLVMTETAYFSSLSRGDCFKDLGVQQYQILATLDIRTSQICQEMDHKTFPMSVYESGVTAPPFHVYCRSTTIPYFGNNYNSVGERAARDPVTNETYYVPANMSYKDWKAQFVNNPSASHGSGNSKNNAPPQPHVNQKIVDNGSGKFIDNSEKSGIIKTDERFEIHPDKINKYLLKPGTAHSAEFFDVGYTPDDYERLFDDFAKGFDISKSCYNRINNAGDEDTSIFMELGVTKIKSFRTVWRIKEKTVDIKPRLLTAHREDEK